MEILDKYMDVFEDVVKNRNDDNISDALVNHDEPQERLTDSEIHEIASHIIYKDDCIWEALYEQIDYLIDREIERRENDNI